MEHLENKAVSNRNTHCIPFIALISLFLSTALCSGCAVVAVERAKDVSSAGIAYTQATAAVIDLAIDATIDYDSSTLLKGTSGNPNYSRTNLLDNHDKELLHSTKLYSLAKRSISDTQAYFVALQQLADGSTADATETLAKSLAGRLNDIETLAKKGTTQTREPELDAIGGVAKVVSKQIHDEKLATVLERDAATLGRALALQNKLLKLAVEDINSYLKLEAEERYLERVQKPFIAGTMERAIWMEERKSLIKIRALSQALEALDTAQASAVKMETIWALIMSGEHSGKELTAILKDAEDLLAAANTLKGLTKTETVTNATSASPNRPAPFTHLKPGTTTTQ